MDPPGAEIANVTGAVLVGVPGRRLGAAKTTALAAERSLVSYPLTVAKEAGLKAGRRGQARWRSAANLQRERGS